MSNYPMKDQSIYRDTLILYADSLPPIEDTLAPELISLDLFFEGSEDNEEIIKFDSNSLEKLYISYEFKEDISGIKSISSLWESPSGTHKFDVYSNDEDLIEGNLLNGLFVDSFLLIDEYNNYPYENGLWTLKEVAIKDNAGNYNFISKDEVEQFGGTTQFLMENSPEDLKPPVIKNIEFSQKTFDFSKEEINDLYIKIQIEEEFSKFW